MRKQKPSLELKPEVSAPLQPTVGPNFAPPSEAKPLAMPTLRPTTKKTKLPYVLGAVVSLLVVVLAVGFAKIYIIKPGQDSPELEPTPSVTTAPTEVPTTSTPTPTLTVTDFPVRILNGGGVAGEAKRVSAALEAAGFKVSSTANAASFDFQETVLSLKSNVPDTIFQLLEQTLTNYKVKRGEALAESEPYSILITIGERR